MAAANYDKQPTISISGNSADCIQGWLAITDLIASRMEQQQREKLIVAVECYPGVDLEEVREALGGIPRTTLVPAESAMRTAAALDQLFSPVLGTDRVFGKMVPWRIADFYDPAGVEQARGTIDSIPGHVLVYGTGAAHVARHWDLLVYLDVTRWEIQQRQRGRCSGNFGASNAGAPASELYKRAYFVDWRAADRERQKLFSSIDFYIDTNRTKSPALLSGECYRKALADAVRQPFRVVPFFDPGPWGGEWMRRHFDLPKEPPNFAWCFDCVPEENSVRLSFGGRVVESPALTLVHQHPEQLLGAGNLQRFGAEFPIRFDFLDTVGGGNLSLQVHPLRSYIREHFGMPYTQDESYYLLDAEEDAVVYLGLKPEISRDKMASDLYAAQQGGAPFPAGDYVNSWPVRKHDHVSIPAGTIHCSGKNSMVLEISATPYIFTFKLWDWGRTGLDGIPRPIHLEHGLANIQWNRTTGWVRENLIGPPRPLGSGPGWREEVTGLNELEFIETRRHWFTAPVLHHTAGNLNVLNLVEGEEAVVESPQGKFQPFIVHYAETFIVPACVGEYRISPTSPVSQPLATIKAYVRESA